MLPSNYHTARWVLIKLDRGKGCHYDHRFASIRYMEACASLGISQFIRNDLWMDGAEELPPPIMQELAQSGSTRDELIATSHTLIAISDIEIQLRTPKK